MGKIGSQEKNQFENIENKNMTVKKKKVQLMNRMDTTEEGISELEDKIKGFSQNINQKGKKINYQRKVMDTRSRNFNICLTGITKEEKKENGMEEIIWV